MQTKDKRFVNRMDRHEQEKYLSSIGRIIPDARDKCDHIEISLEPIRLLTKRRVKQPRFEKPAVIPEAAELDDGNNNQD